MALTDYSRLVTSEHADKPKFVAVVRLLTEAFSKMQAGADASFDVDGTVDMLVDPSGGFGSLGAFPAAHDLDLATGVQLDTLGLWIGLTRSQNLVGYGYVSLNDEDYRSMLRAKIQANHWDGSMEGLQALLSGLFPHAAFTLQLVDNQDMTMTVLVVGSAPSAIQTAMLSSDLIIPRPEGVLISTFSAVAGPLFGLDYGNAYIAGPDVGSL